MNITFVTGNKNKVKEAEKILGFPLKVKNVDLDEIQELDVKKVALHKVNQAYGIVKGSVLVDDVGIYINAWNGFPGPLIKWILKSGEADLLLKMMKEEKDRRVTARLAIGFHDGQMARVFIGERKGIIAEEKKGEPRVGWWDTIFIPEGFEKTYAEMSLDEKNKISHRREGLEEFKKFLNEQK